MQIFKDLWRIISTEDFRNYLLQGFGNTLLITICAALIGLFIGFVVAIVKILVFIKFPPWRLIFLYLEYIKKKVS